MKKTVYELREELRRAELEEAEQERLLALNKKEKFEESSELHVYTSDDYCGLDVGENLSFYYGYEQTKCSVKSHKEDCEDNGCEKREWCFVAYKNGKEVMRMPTSKLHPTEGEEPFWYLVAGIGHYLKKQNETDFEKN